MKFAIRRADTTNDAIYRKRYAHAVKSCFAGLSSDGFDFIQGLDLGFHLSRAKISSWFNHDFIYPAEKERTFRFSRFVLSFCFRRGGDVFDTPSVNTQNNAAELVLPEVLDVGSSKAIGRAPPLNIG